MRHDHCGAVEGLGQRGPQPLLADQRLLTHGFVVDGEGEKMSPWAQAVFDTLGSVTNRNVIEEVMARDLDRKSTRLNSSH